MTINERLKNFKHIVIAVVDEGRPWAVPIGVAKYSKGSFEWFSRNDAVHSKNITINPEIMITAYTTKRHTAGEFGFYARATAKKTLSLPGGLGYYRAEIYECWYNDAKHKKIKLKLEDL